MHWVNLIDLLSNQLKIKNCDKRQVVVFKARCPKQKKTASRVQCLASRQLFIFLTGTNPPAHESPSDVNLCSTMPD